VPNRAVIDINGDMIALVGPNNAGKSTLLKFFFEFRPLFQHLSQGVIEGNFHSGIPVSDIMELFSNQNNNQIEIVFEKQKISKQETINYCYKLNLSIWADKGNLFFCGASGF
jgi:ATPase subunit of ABC transporter with duplicated ATPase domains